VHLLVVCGVGDGECRGQVIQERKPHPMVEVCQLTDVRGECAVGRGGRWRALLWKGGNERGDVRRPGPRQPPAAGSCPLCWPSHYSTLYLLRGKGLQQVTCGAKAR
jgi:hypothetical protein